MSPLGVTLNESPQKGEKMTVDWNRLNLEGYVFHFKASLRPFIEVKTPNGYGFLDLNDFTLYELDTLESEGLFFFEKEDDEDFKGVMIDGRVQWVE